MWVLIRKDLLRRWRSPLSTIVMIIFPLFMSLAIGSISGGSGGGSEFPRIKVLLQNNDKDGFLSNAIMGSAGQGENQEYLDLVEVGDEGTEMMNEGKASAMIVLPENFTAKVFNREPVEILVVRNPAEGIKPEIVVQGADVVATYLDPGSPPRSTEWKNICFRRWWKSAASRKTVRKRIPAGASTFSVTS